MGIWRADVLKTLQLSWCNKLKLDFLSFFLAYAANITRENVLMSRLEIPGLTWVENHLCVALSLIDDVRKVQSDKEKTLVVMQKPCCVIFFPSSCLCQLIPVVDLQLAQAWTSCLQWWVLTSAQWHVWKENSYWWNRPKDCKPALPDNSSCHVLITLRFICVSCL